MEFTKGSIEGISQKIPQEMLDQLLYISGAYHWRDGKKWNDGSRGTMNISPKEFIDLLSFITISTIRNMTDGNDEGLGTDGEGE